MEPIGFVTGVVALAGLFSTCIECWDYVDTARSYGRDYEILATKLEIEKTRFLIWGDAIGVLETTEGEHDGSLDSPQVAQVVQRILNCIIRIFTDTEALVARYGLQDAQPGDCFREDKALSTNQLTKFQASYRQFQARIEHEQNKATFLNKTRWAIKDRSKFTNLVDEIRQFVNSLKDITEFSGNCLKQRQRAAIEEEIEALADVRSIRLVKDASENVHTDWSDAATQILEMSILDGEDREDIFNWITNTDDTELYRQAALETLNDAGLDISMRGFENLHWAAINGHVHVVQFLLDQGVEIDARDGQRRTALLHAIESEQTGVVQCLISRGANVEARQSDERPLTPLSLAVMSRNKDIVLLLVKNGAVIDSWDSEMKSPLIRAAHFGDVDIIEVLLTYGANIEARTIDGATALNYAARRQHTEAVKLLLRSGANVECAFKDQVKRGLLNLVQALLENGAKVEALHKHFGKTPLLEAAVCEGSADIIRLLVRYGANVEAVSSEGTTALMLAAERGDLENLKALVELGVPLDVRNMKGKTAVMFAVYAGRRASVQFLVSKGADLKLLDRYGGPVLHMAAFQGHFEITNDLINLRTDIDYRCHGGETALFIAANCGHYNVVKLLLEHGASKRIMNHAGETPMVGPIRKGYRAIAELLSDGYKVPSSL